jgi:hypothetical protein
MDNPARLIRLRIVPATPPDPVKREQVVAAFKQVLARQIARQVVRELKLGANNAHLRLHPFLQPESER